MLLATGMVIQTPIQTNNIAIKGLHYKYFVMEIHLSPTELPYKGPILWNVLPYHYAIFFIC